MATRGRIVFSCDWFALAQVGTCEIWPGCRSSTSAPELDRLRTKRVWWGLVTGRRGRCGKLRLLLISLWTWQPCKRVHRRRGVRPQPWEKLTEKKKIQSSVSVQGRQPSASWELRLRARGRHAELLKSDKVAKSILAARLSYTWVPALICVTQHNDRKLIKFSFFSEKPCCPSYLGARKDSYQQLCQRCF